MGNNVSNFRVEEFDSNALYTKDEINRSSENVSAYLPN
jgi:hypothetical protein